MTRQDYDMDNFSGRWNRGARYNILIGDYIEYHDVPEESVDELCIIAQRKADIFGEEVTCKEI